MTVLLDWLGREGQIVFAWWLWITLAGAAAFPLCLRLLGGLPDKGYTLARALGMLLVTFIFWLLGSYGALDNSAGGIVFSWLLLLILALVFHQRYAESNELAIWWRENRSLIIAAELLFLVLFVGWAIFRAHQNGLTGTEKPMELAFFSAAQRSAVFPPGDPWMSGYAISYYYMGYVMWSALATLSGVASSVGFNLTVASLFALTGLSAFGVAYNLVRSRSGPSFGLSARPASRRVGIAAGLLAMALITLVGNFQMVFIEAPFQTRSAARSTLDFWGTQARSNFADGAYEQDPSAELSLHSASWGNWWWFSASRVITDYDLQGKQIGTQPIGEFPAFSFILGDNHPHVLALPFTVLVIGLMLNLLLRRRAPSASELILYGLAVGGLTFLNAWDGPIYFIGLAGAEALRRLMTSDRGKLMAGDLLALIRFGASLALVALLAYLPYFVGFRSQAGGILPNLRHPTQFQQFFIMFGPLLLIGAYLAAEVWRGHRARRLDWRFALAAGGALWLALAGLMTVLSLALFPEESAALLGQLLQRRIDFGFTSLLLLLGIIMALARLFPGRQRSCFHGEVAIDWVTYPPRNGFVLLLIGMGLVLTIFPEFLYLKDNFGVRINTVFKFYYQAWGLWSLAVAYAAYSILADGSGARPHPLLRLAFAAMLALSLGPGLLYTIEAVYHRSWIETGRQHTAAARAYAPPADWEGAIRRVAEGEVVAPGRILFSRGDLDDAAEGDLIRADHAGIVVYQDGAVIVEAPLTLDGAKGLLNLDDQQVITCLSELVGRADVVVAEAVGEPYRVEYGRVGTLTGIPIVLGWENHERQWRGNTYADIAGTRNVDLRRLYTAAEMDDVVDIIERYDIDYILYGTSERHKYDDLGEEKFADHLPVVCQHGHSRIYYSAGD
ncbi:MAG: DUF2298 domain-containing protein [Chloroflexota bacterium]|nr:DUF2298 domain-containing protein [Chloroflexota bacterium]MDE2947205.1 DUF2298 domain-containing protein [Chloroflexota bacterium]